MQPNSHMHVGYIFILFVTLHLRWLHFSVHGTEWKYPLKKQGRVKNKFEEEMFFFFSGSMDQDKHMKLFPGL